MQDNASERCLINWKNAQKFILYPLLIVLGVGLIYVWVKSASPGVAAGYHRRKEIKPLLAEAKTLSLDYEKVLNSRGAAAGKPVVWCLQNRGPYYVTINGDEKKRLKVSNYSDMPAFSGSKHSPCTDMLVIVEEVINSGLRPPQLTVKFVEQLE